MAGPEFTMIQRNSLKSKWNPLWIENIWLRNKSVINTQHENGHLSSSSAERELHLQRNINRILVNNALLLWNQYKNCISEFGCDNIRNLQHILRAIRENRGAEILLRGRGKSWTTSCSPSIHWVTLAAKQHEITSWQRYSKKEHFWQNKKPTAVSSTLLFVPYKNQVNIKYKAKTSPQIAISPQRICAPISPFAAMYVANTKNFYITLPALQVLIPGQQLPHAFQNRLLDKQKQKEAGIRKTAPLFIKQILLWNLQTFQSKNFLVITTDEVPHIYGSTLEKKYIDGRYHWCSICHYFSAEEGQWALWSLNRWWVTREFKSWWWGLQVWWSAQKM